MPHGNQDTAYCIQRLLQRELYEYWNSYVGNSDSAVIVWASDDCRL